MEGTSYDILGAAILHEVGAEAPSAGGFDLSQLLNVAAEAGSKGIKYAQDKKAAEASAADADAKAAAVIALDAAALDACVALALARLTPDTAAIEARQAAAESAFSAQREAATDLPPAAAVKRLAAIRATAAAAARAWAGAPADQAKRARAACSKELAASIAAPAMTPQPGTVAAASSVSAPVVDGSFMTFLKAKRMGVPTWGWGVGGAVVLTGGVLLVKHWMASRQVAF